MFLINVSRYGDGMSARYLEYISALVVPRCSLWVADAAATRRQAAAVDSDIFASRYFPAAAAEDDVPGD